MALPWVTYSFINSDSSVYAVQLVVVFLTLAALELTLSSQILSAAY